MIMDRRNIILRKATQDDCSLLYEWVNDEEVRRNSLDQHLINKDEHNAWFDKMMKDSSQVQYIMMQKEKPIGQVRVTIEDDVAEIHYSITKAIRGQGMGQELIRLVVDTIKKEYPSVTRVVGKIKADNMASLRCFSKNEFEERYRVMEYTIKD